MHILVVDDEPDVRRISARLLKSAGHTTESAGSVAEALAFLSGQAFDLALLDIDLGDDSGLALARVIRQAHPQTAVIMVTGHADFTSVSDARIAGALDYLTKPFEGAALIDAVHRADAIRQRKNPRSVKLVESTPAPAPAVPHVPTRSPVQLVPVASHVASAPPPLVEARDGEPPIHQLFRKMVAQGASDLHLSAGVAPNIRRDGEMRPLDSGARPLSAEDVVQLVAPIIPGKNRGEFEADHDADFAYELDGETRFRANIFRDRKGMGAVFRRVPTRIMTAEDLDLSDSILRLCALKKGLVLITGPTGSGKSTTLAAMIDYVNRTRHDHIVTIEDPIEFVHANKQCVINQREVHTHTRSFKAALRAALREDPDIVLIGEMRDLETISIALETAETGHLVFGTLHTSTAATTIDRIIDQFPAGNQSQIRVMLAESLKGVIAQTLCRKVGGGRVAALEVLVVTTAVSNLIREGKTHQIPTMMQVGRGSGMVTLEDALKSLVERNLVTAEEAKLNTPEAR